MHVHDIDVLRAALAMIQHHGPYALQRALARPYALQRALALAHIDNFWKAEDMIGVFAWTFIADAIKELRRVRRNDEPLN
jgi:hypothetical protein